MKERTQGAAETARLRCCRSRKVNARARWALQRRPNLIQQLPPWMMLIQVLNKFCAYPAKFLLQLLVYEHQSFDSATQITVTSGDDLVHILLVFVEIIVGVCA